MSYYYQIQFDTNKVRHYSQCICSIRILQKKSHTSVSPDEPHIPSLRDGELQPCINIITPSFFSLNIIMKGENVVEKMCTACCVGVTGHQHDRTERCNVHYLSNWARALWIAYKYIFYSPQPLSGSLESFSLLKQPHITASSGASSGVPN